VFLTLGILAGFLLNQTYFKLGPTTSKDIKFEDKEQEFIQQQVEEDEWETDEDEIDTKTKKPKSPIKAAIAYDKAL
jgi:hypothetical protein